MPVAVAEVAQADHVLVLDFPGIVRMPAAQDERRREGLVAELAHVDRAVRAADVGEQELLHVVLAQRLRPLTVVIPPLVLPLQPLVDIHDGCVLLAVMLV